MEETLKTILQIENKFVCHCYIDIDDFRLFNINNSYELGNLRLEQLENIIKVEISPAKTIRVGSDEFYIMFQDSFEKVKNKLFGLLSLINKKFDFTVSIGATEENNLSPEGLIERLKQNTHLAKVYGKNKLYIQ
ncbi:MAG TPA: GGDEF domain-containing protein [Bacteroidales bacterium]|nr:GGDEF domain-containing protein [Bacteroidales bacterium]